MVGRTPGTTKDPNRRRVRNPNGRLIDFGGPQYQNLIRRGYKLNRAETKLIKDRSFQGDRNAPLPRGRPRGTVPASERVINPLTKRLITKNGQLFKKLSKIYRYDETRDKFVTTVVDPIHKNQIRLDGDKFEKRLKHGHIYNKLDNSLSIPSRVMEKAYGNYLVTYDLTIANNSDPIIQMQKLDRRIKFLLTRKLKELKGIKFYLSMTVVMTKVDEENDKVITNTFYVGSDTSPVTNLEFIQNTIQDKKEQITRKIDRLTTGGSGWSVQEITHHHLNIDQYQPLAGKSYIPLPAYINNKKATINIKNDDNKCFMYCLGRVLDPNPEKKNLGRVSKHLKEVCVELGLDKIKMPVSLKDILKIEKEFKICINIFGLEGTSVYPLQLTEAKYDKHIDLLYIEKDDKEHYVWIKDFDKLHLRINKDNNKKYFCKHCMQYFYTNEKREKHMKDCRDINGTQAVEMLVDKDGNPKTISFFHSNNSLACPFVIYADIEALLIEEKKKDKVNPAKSYTVKLNRHEACSYGYKVVCHDNDKLSKPFKMFRGKDAITKFFEALFEEENEIIEHMKRFKKSDIIMTKAQVEEYNSAETCYVCNGKFTQNNRKVRDHNHVSGEYRGAAHNKCNLKLKLSYKIPVIFHNLKNYDSHHLIQKLGQFKIPINIIPNNMEKYMSFSIGTERKEWDKKTNRMKSKVRHNLTFIDSFQFMASSLSALTGNLRNSGLDKFKYTGEEFKSLTEMMTRKGVYPYSFMNKWKKFEVNPRKLKPKDFTNDLTGEKITDDDFKFFQKVCKKFRIKNLGEYHDLYLKTDVLLLADIFENFRKTCLNYYKLDPAHYYTAPGLSWDACLKMTGIVLELLKDIDMHLFVEKGLRGGVSIITHRKGNANNKYMSNFDKNKPSKYISYFDANNLYGWGMSQTMPYGGFKWVKPKKYVLPDYETLCSNKLPKGHILEVDLEYPEELHDLHNDYPYCPEHVRVTDEMLSGYSKRLAKAHNIKTGNYAKLIPSLLNKKEYVIHERNLRQAIDAGLILTKIHRVLQFDQKPWIKDYIDFNTEKRKLAKNEFEKDFFKLMNNSFFGKTMEDKRKRVNIKLINNNKKQLLKYIAKPTYIGRKIFDEYLVAIHNKQPTIKLDKPIYAGFCILELSKTLMYDFHYGYIKQKYGNRAKLLFTDTDSLCYEIQTKDIYKDLHKNKELFDMSDVKNEKLLKFKDESNKKVIGKMKLEYVNNPIQEFIGLRSKMYSVKFDDGKEDKKAKGIVKSVIKKNLKHDMYKHTLETEGRMYSRMNVIRSSYHQLYTMQMNKVSLSAYDDKRFIKKDGITSYAYGHYRM